MPVERLYSDTTQIVVTPSGIGASRLTLSPALLDKINKPDQIVITRQEVAKMIKDAIAAIPAASPCVKSPDNGLSYKWVPYVGDVDPVSGLPVIVGEWKQC